GFGLWLGTPQRRGCCAIAKDVGVGSRVVANNDLLGLGAHRARQVFGSDYGTATGETNRRQPVCPWSTWRILLSSGQQTGGARRHSATKRKVKRTLCLATLRCDDLCRAWR